MRNYLTTLLIATILFFFSGCQIPYSFSMVPSKIETENKFDLKDKVLGIEFFNDLRKDNPENQIFFTKKKSTKVDNQKVCINSERSYKRPVNQILAKASSIYFKNSLRFKNVVFGKKTRADYYIKADLKEFKAIQVKSKEAAKHGRSGLFEVLGALPAITAPLGNSGLYVSAGGGGSGSSGNQPVFRSASQVNIAITNIQIYNSKDELIGTLDDVGIIDNRQYIADAACWCAFWSTEFFYKELNLKLIEDTVKFLEDYNLKQQ